MPWLETAPMEERERFVRDHREGFYAVGELCARYGVRSGRPATNGSPASRTADGKRSGIRAVPRIAVRTGSRMTSPG